MQTANQRKLLRMKSHLLDFRTAETFQKQDFKLLLLANYFRSKAFLLNYDGTSLKNFFRKLKLQKSRQKRFCSKVSSAAGRLAEDNCPSASDSAPRTVAQQCALMISFDT